MTVDNNIVNAFIQLTNHFADGVPIDPPLQKISTLAELWEKHGTMIAGLMQCDRLTFKSSDIFYEVIFRKLRLANGELAADLNPEKAAAGDLLEISKFYVVYLEFMRKDHSSKLTEVIETLASETGFNSAPLLELFAFLDNLYEEDSVDNWWSCLCSTDNEEVMENLSTPTRKSAFNTSFATPNASARRFRTAVTSARRSPIAEAVDSPTMKFMRSERELKTEKKKRLQLETAYEELDVENKALVADNRALKLKISSLKGDAAGNRDTAENAERVADELQSSLEAKQLEVQQLTQQLEESRNLRRLELRNLEALEVEKSQLVSKLQSAIDHRDVCMKQIRDLRDSNEHEFSTWRQKEQDLTEKLRGATLEIENMAEQLSCVGEIRAGLVADNDRLTMAVAELSTTAARKEQDAANLVDQLKIANETYQNRIQQLTVEHTNRIKMAEDTCSRLQNELEVERKYKQSMQVLLNELNEKALKDNKDSHEQKEGQLSVKSCLETAKQRIEELELELKLKEAHIAFQAKQIESLSGVMQTEQNIREKFSEQYKKKVTMLEGELAAKSDEVVQLTERLKSSAKKYDAEHLESLAAIEEKNNEIKQLLTERDGLNLQLREQSEKNMFIEEKNRILCDSRLSLDSITSEVTKVVSEDTDELEKILAETPRKSVAFNVDLNDMAQLQGTPAGFRIGGNPRESISSFNEEMFDRESTTRASVRSDVTLPPPKEFKSPFIPPGTSKERLGTLKARNAAVRPHLKSSYATEMSNVQSPSGNEENIRNASENPKKKNRRESIVSAMSSILGNKQ